MELNRCIAIGCSLMSVSHFVTRALEGNKIVFWTKTKEKKRKQNSLWKDIVTAISSS